MKQGNPRNDLERLLRGLPRVQHVKAGDIYIDRIALPVGEFNFDMWIPIDSFSLPNYSHYKAWKPLGWKEDSNHVRSGGSSCLVGSVWNITELGKQNLLPKELVAILAPAIMELKQVI